ncbi:hypothetical protein TRICHSKD4_0871 [Roseibium sp. TrichSKD4]|nr:hypothetical protein TRICHSKD4_0871 [Roseibium sp. TrichSKD4]
MLATFRQTHLTQLVPTVASLSGFCETLLVILALWSAPDI